MERVVQEQMPPIYVGEHVSRQLKAVISKTVDIASYIRTQGAAHAAMLVPAFIDIYLTLRVHHYCKELKEVQKVECRSRRAAGQPERPATMAPGNECTASSKRQLKKLNVIK